jgi:hypothetical protein
MVIFFFGIVIGAMSVMEEAKEIGYMKVDPKDNKLKWAHKIKE